MSRVRVELEFDSIEEMVRVLGGTEPRHTAVDPATSDKVWSTVPGLGVTSAVETVVASPERAEPPAADPVPGDPEPEEPEGEATATPEPVTEEPPSDFEQNRRRPIYYELDGDLGTCYSDEEWKHKLEPAGAVRLKKPEYQAKLEAAAPAETVPTDPDATENRYPPFNGLAYLKNPEDGHKVAARTFTEMKEHIDAGWVVIDREEYERPVQAAAASESEAGAEPPSKEDAHAALKRLTQARDMETGLAVLQQFQARRLSELEAGDYPAFIAECERQATA